MRGWSGAAGPERRLGPHNPQSWVACIEAEPSLSGCLSAAIALCPPSPQDAERRNEARALLRRSALLSARVERDPSDVYRARLPTFLALIAAPLPAELDGS